MRAVGWLLVVAGVLAAIAAITADPLDGWPVPFAELTAAALLVCGGELLIAEGGARARERARERRRPGYIDRDR